MITGPRLVAAADEVKMLRGCVARFEKLIFSVRKIRTKDKSKFFN